MIVLKISEVTIGRKFNLGNYESLEIRITVSPATQEEDLQFDQCLTELTTKLDVKIKEMEVKLK